MNEFFLRMYIIMIKMNILYLDILFLFNVFILVIIFFFIRDLLYFKC